MDINLTLTVDEVNVILASLGKHPFDQIAALVQKIKTQGQPQVNEKTPVEQGTTDSIAAE
jgi:hypothetical protein